jgi:hypothetical protein
LLVSFKSVQHFGHAPHFCNLCQTVSIQPVYNLRASSSGCTKEMHQMKSIVTLRFCVSFIVLTAAAIGAPACLGQPATTSPVQTTQPSVAGGRTEGAIIADFKQTIGKLHETMGDVEQLADPQARARIAPQAVPLLRRLVDDLDELVRIQCWATRAGPIG